MDKLTAVSNSTSIFFYVENFYTHKMTSLIDWGTSMELKMTFEINTVNIGDIIEKLRPMVHSECEIQTYKRVEVENEYISIFWRYNWN